MDSRRSCEKSEGQNEDAFQAVDSREGTCVPNSPVLATLKSSSSPAEGSPAPSVMLDDLEKGQTSVSSAPVTDSRIRRHFKDDVSAEWADVMLLLCWFTTGFVDSTIFNGMLRSCMVLYRKPSLTELQLMEPSYRCRRVC